MSQAHAAGDSLSSYTVTTAEEVHAEAISRLVLDSGLNPSVLDWRNFHVALDERGILVGCGQLKRHADGSLELASLAVVPALQRLGIGGRLIREIVAGRQETIYLMCQSNLGKMYSKFGFEKIEEEEMPAFFRRVSRLPGVLGKLQAEGESLYIMRRAV